MSSNGIITGAVSRFCDIWFDARAEADSTLPRMEDLCLTRLAPYMPAVSAGALDAEGEPRIILFGTALVDAYGQDMTGASVRDLMSGAALEEYDRQPSLFHPHPETGAIIGQLYVSHIGNLDSKSVKFEGITLPYATRTPGEIRRMTFTIQIELDGYGYASGRQNAADVMRSFDARGPRPDWLYRSKAAA